MLTRPRRATRDRGAVLVLVAPMLVAIFAITALVIDMGNARQESRHTQASADAVALAGARELPVMSPVNDVPFARVRAQAVEFADKNLDDATVSFSETACPGDALPAATCYEAGDTDLTVVVPYTSANLGAPKSYNLVYIEICQPTTTFFSQVIGSSSPTVCREAVGRRQNTAGGFGMGLIVIEPTGCNALTFSGTSETILSSNGAVMVNSACPDAALSANGTSWDLVTEYVGVVGGANLAPCEPPSQCTATEPTTGINPFADPFADVEPPDPLPETSPTNLCTKTGDVAILQPGRYTANCQITSGDFILRPGLYYFEKGFKSTGGSIVCSSTHDTVPTDRTEVLPCDAGVTLIIGGGEFAMTGNGWVSLPPPPSGPYAGISVYQVSADASAVNGTSDFELGTIYAPNAYYKFTGSGGGDEVNIYGMVVTKTADISGKFTFNIEVPEDSPEALLEDDFGLWE